MKRVCFLMKIVLINPPFTDPLVPPASIATIAETFQNKFDIIAYDLNLELFASLYEFYSSGFVRSIQKNFEDLPSLLNIKNQERDILNQIYIKDGFKIGRCFSEICDIWPETTFINSINRFEASTVGRTFKKCVLKYINTFLDTNYILISVSYDAQAVPSVITAKILRDNGYKGIIAFGGTFASWTYKYLISNAFIANLLDFVYLGEIPFDCDDIVEKWPLLLKQRQTLDNYKTIQPLIISRKHSCDPNKCDHFTPAELLCCGDGYSYLPMKDYWGTEPLVCAQITKGCYYGKCSFCSYGFIKDHAYIAVDPVAAAKRIITFEKNLGLSALCLETDVIDTKTMFDVAIELKKMGSNIKWHAVTRFEDDITYNILKALYNGGCRRLYFGFESASPKVLDFMNKGIKLETVKNVIKFCGDIGIGVEIGIVFGFPGETKKDVDLTLEFLEQNNKYLHRLDPSIFRCVTNSPAANNPSDFGINIIGRDPNWYTMKWEYLNNIDSYRPEDSIEKVKSMNPNILDIDISEDILLVCKHGINHVDSYIK